MIEIKKHDSDLFDDLDRTQEIRCPRNKSASFQKVLMILDLYTEAFLIGETDRIRFETDCYSIINSCTYLPFLQREKLVKEIAYHSLIAFRLHSAPSKNENCLRNQKSSRTPPQITNLIISLCAVIKQKNKINNSDAAKEVATIFQEIGLPNSADTIKEIFERRKRRTSLLKPTKPIFSMLFNVIEI